MNSTYDVRFDYQDYSNPLIQIEQIVDLEKSTTKSSESLLQSEKSLEKLSLIRRLSRDTFYVVYRVNAPIRLVVKEKIEYLNSYIDKKFFVCASNIDYLLTIAQKAKREELSEEDLESFTEIKLFSLKEIKIAIWVGKTLVKELEKLRWRKPDSPLYLYRDLAKKIAKIVGRYIEKRLMEEHKPEMVSRFSDFYPFIAYVSCFMRGKGLEETIRRLSEDLPEAYEKYRPTDKYTDKELRELAKKEWEDLQESLQRLFGDKYKPPSERERESQIQEIYEELKLDNELFGRRGQSPTLTTY